MPQQPQDDGPAVPAASTTLIAGAIRSSVATTAGGGYAIALDFVHPSEGAVVRVLLPAEARDAIVQAFDSAVEELSRKQNGLTPANLEDMRRATQKGDQSA